MRKWILAALLATSSMTAPVAAFDETEATADAAKEADAMEQMTKLFSSVFDSKDATPIDPARLALAEQTTTTIMPDGIYARIMKDMTDKIFGALFSSGNGMSDFEIMLTTGVEIDAAKFDDEKRKAVTAILDPSHADRSSVMQSVMNPMFDTMATAIEGPMRKGLARAYARKFTAEQLTELNSFFATPTGSFYAAESFALQADPEVMQAVFSSLPEMMKGFADPGKEVEEKMAAIPPARKLSDLSDKDLANLAKLLGTTVEGLRAKVEAENAAEAAGDAAAEAMKAGVEAMAEEAADSNDPFANDSGTEPWWDRDNWDERDREKVKSEELEVEFASDRLEAASDGLRRLETEIMLRVRDRYLKQGWKPSDSSE